MTALHPMFAVRDAALVEFCYSKGIVVGATSTCRSRSAQTALFAEKPRLAADPYARGSISPWGWRSTGSLHMEQPDGYCHAKDYTIRARPGFAIPVWSRFHALAVPFGVCFPLANRHHQPGDAPNEPWHGQIWTAQSSGGLRDAPALADLGIHVGELPEPPGGPEPVPAAPRSREEAEMHEFTPNPRPNVPNTLDYTWLPGEGTAYGVMTSSKLYVRRMAAAFPPDHVIVFMAGKNITPLTADNPRGLIYLPENGTPVEVPVRAGFCSVEGQGAQPFSSAQYASWYVG